MINIQYFEQTTQETDKVSTLWINKCSRKTPLTLWGSFFCFYTLSGTQPKKEPLVDKGSKTATFSGVCSFLYILDMTGFSLQVVGEMMHKKHTFYTYAKHST